MLPHADILWAAVSLAPFSSIDALRCSLNTEAFLAALEAIPKEAPLAGVRLVALFLAAEGRLTKNAMLSFVAFCGGISTERLSVFWCLMAMDAACAEQEDGRSADAVEFHDACLEAGSGDGTLAALCDVWNGTASVWDFVGDAAATDVPHDSLVVFAFFTANFSVISDEGLLQAACEVACSAASLPSPFKAFVGAVAAACAILGNGADAEAAAFSMLKTCIGFSSRDLLLKARRSLIVAAFKAHLAATHAHRQLPVFLRESDMRCSVIGALIQKMVAKSGDEAARLVGDALVLLS